MNALQMSISKRQDFTLYFKKKKRPLKVLRGKCVLQGSYNGGNYSYNSKKKPFKTAQNKTCKLAASKIRYRRR